MLNEVLESDLAVLLVCVCAADEGKGILMIHGSLLTDKRCL